MQIKTLGLLKYAIACFLPLMLGCSLLGGTKAKSLAFPARATFLEGFEVSKVADKPAVYKVDPKDRTRSKEHRPIFLTLIESCPSKVSISRSILAYARQLLVAFDNVEIRSKELVEISHTPEAAVLLAQGEIDGEAYRLAALVLSKGRCGRDLVAWTRKDSGFDSAFLKQIVLTLADKSEFK